MTADRDVAIIGMACRFPGAVRTAEDLLRLSVDGVDAIDEVPESRQLRGLYSPDPTEPGRISTRWIGSIDGIDRFDAEFFGITAREAEQMDPQQRILLETAYEALELAGVPPTSGQLSDGGVYVGISGSDYGRLLGRRMTELGGHFVTGQASSVAANRLSYLLDMSGPSMAVDTACSSSLVAVHLAVRALREGDCPLALAAGVNLVLAPDNWVSVSKAGMMSPTGRCHSFGAEADGFVRADGCGVLVLKTLARARRDGDEIHAVIRGSAINQDGASNGLTAPNGPAQEAVIRAALADAGVRPEEVGYVEAHGSGTPLGDPIEFAALAATYGKVPAGSPPCYVGSVKSNLGHAEAAAGMAGIIRLVTCLRAGYVPASLHTEELNPRLATDGTRLAVARRTARWSDGPDRRTGAVSSFGFGGTNAHVLVQQADPVSHRSPAPAPTGLVLPLSAKGEEPLRELAERYASLLSDDGTAAGDLCYSAAARRAHHPVRGAFSGRDRAELRRSLESFLADGGVPDTVEGLVWRDTVYVCPGLGPQTSGLGSALLSEPTLVEHCHRCSDAFAPLLGVSLFEYLSQGGPEADEIALTRTDIAQALHFTVQSGLAGLWSSFGLRPAAVIGHSAGEPAAAYVSGMLDFDAAVELVAARGSVMQHAAVDGRMVAVSAAPQEIDDLLARCPDDIVLAVDNGPRNVTLSGPAEAVEQLAAQLRADGLRARLLSIRFGSHHPDLAPAGEELARRGVGAATAPGSVPMFSSITGALLDSVQMTAEHWGRGVINPVLLRSAVQQAATAGFANFLEISPQQMLLGPVHTSAAAVGVRASVLHALGEGDDGAASARAVLPELYVRRAELDWQAVYPDGRFLPSTPSYPWQGRRYWALDGWTHTTLATSTIPTSTAPTTPTVPSTPTATEPAQEPLRRSTLAASQEHALAEVTEEIAAILKYPRERITPQSFFLELGADSILLLQLVNTLNNRHGTSFKATDLFEKYQSVGDLADALAESGTFDVEPLGGPQATVAVAQAPAAVPQVLAVPPQEAAVLPAATGLDAVVRDQLAIMRQQLAVLGGTPTPLTEVAAPVDEPPAAPPPVLQAVSQREAPAARRSPAPAPAADGARLGPRQKSYVDSLVRRMEERSPRSKRLAGLHRGRMVESRPWGTFRPELKELNFPIIIDRGRGAHFWDADGSQYTDYCLGFGVHFFGHNPPFVQDAIATQLKRSFMLGPQVELTYQVAEQFCRITGHDRVSFCNSGSESVMGAVRLARLATGRRKVAYFEKSYHGITDGVLGLRGEELGGVRPIVDGVSPGALQDVVVLPYDDQAALDYIASHSHELAAVLVEPIQARNPVTQPAEFLHKLRRLTEDTGTVLIFDEMITGFRMHIRGAQGLFGIKPDLAIYGKVLGGGLPVAAIAGKQSLMDGLDGGNWDYGDRSAPTAETTFFGGTFQKHPLAMAATKAALEYLEQHEDTVYRDVNDRTARVVGALSDLFTQHGVAYTLASVGSLWRFQYRGQSNLYHPLPLEMLYHSLLADGVYMWEGRTFFMSTAHTDDDAERLIDAVDRGLHALREADFLDGVATTPRVRAAERWPMSTQQREVWDISQRLGPSSVVYNETAVLELTGELDLPALDAALTAVRQRHPALRAVCSADGRDLVVEHDAASTTVVHTVAPEDSPQTVIDERANTPFDLRTGPLFRAMVLRHSEDRHHLLVSGHHVVFDGTSMVAVLNDLADGYTRVTQGRALARVQPGRVQPAYPEPAADKREAALDHWQQRLAAPPAPAWAVQDRPASAPATRQAFEFDAVLWTALVKRCPQLRCSPFMAVFSAFTAALHEVTRHDDLVVSTPVDQCRGVTEQELVGHFVSYVPVRSRHIDTDLPKHRQQFSQSLGEDLSHGTLPLGDVLDELAERGELDDPWLARQQLTSVVFNLNRPLPPPRIGDLEARVSLPSTVEAMFDLLFDVVPMEDKVFVEIVYRDQVPADDITRLWTRWLELLHETADDGGA
ncbi:aminotransferase class III-fold pyridoxal phosphate-dependent enzyme [Streptomyces sp. NA02950]|uniref:type I polyketide synthase n=1 Tax=Streptomyces sp. NA02950 TaxID=2742137 RepID=UPI0015912455|nr:type I polyketide synthase [Streptomyces sp. NA02950]QKV97162.1 aminotransferase class III-fold pyridoxal phosphate-dependent enzyme [Streptomyces sp. NA02950]